MSIRLPAQSTDGPQLPWSDLIGFQRFHYQPEKKNAVAHTSDFIEGLGLQVFRATPTHLKVSALRFGTFLVMHIQIANFHLRWTRELPKADTKYLFAFVNRGSIDIDSNVSHWSTQNGGLCIIFPGSSAVDIRSDELTELILFSFDQTEVTPHVLAPTNISELSPQSPVFRASFAYLQAVVRPAPGTSPTDDDPVILRAITRDIARAVTASATAKQFPNADLASIQSIISQRSVNPEFNPEVLATLCGISRSTLNRLYSQHGLQVSREIRRSRAHRAMERLGSSTALSLDEVATASGFGSRSSMNRAFKEIYGVLPSIASASSS